MPIGRKITESYLKRTHLVGRLQKQVSKLRHKIRRFRAADLIRSVPKNFIQKRLKRRVNKFVLARQNSTLTRAIVHTRGLVPRLQIRVPQAHVYRRTSKRRELRRKLKRKLVMTRLRSSRGYQNRQLQKLGRKSVYHPKQVHNKFFQYMGIGAFKRSYQASYLRLHLPKFRSQRVNGFTKFSKLSNRVRQVYPRLIRTELGPSSFEAKRGVYQRNLKVPFKRSTRFTYRSVSSLSYRVHKKLPFVGGGLSITDMAPQVYSSLASQLILLILKKLTFNASEPQQLIETHSLLHSPLKNSASIYRHKCETNYLLSHLDKPILDKGIYSRDTAALSQALRLHYLGKQNNVQPISVNLVNTYSTSKKLTNGLYLGAADRDYITPNRTNVLDNTESSFKTYGSAQFFYNSLQSYLIYKHSLKQHLATSKTASLILSFETRKTRLNTLPIFLELKRRPFGVGINPPHFDLHQSALQHQVHNYLGTFLNPIQELSKVS